jgi:hypothetical protein
MKILGITIFARVYNVCRNDGNIKSIQLFISEEKLVDMKKYLIYLLLLAVIATCICGCSQKMPENTSINDTNISLNNTISGSGIPATLNWSRYIDIDNKVSIEVPDNFIVEKTSQHRINIYSQPRMQERVDNITWVDTSSPFWQSITNSSSYVSDIVLNIYTSKWVTDPKDMADSRVENINKTQPSTKTRRNEIIINGLPVSQVIYESPNSPYWVENFLIFNGEFYTIEYGEYKISQYDQMSNNLSHMIETLKFLNANAIPAEGIKYITVRPTIQPVAPLEEEVLNESITLKQGELKKYWNSFGKDAVIEIHSDIPISIVTKIGDMVARRSDEITNFKMPMNDVEYILMNNNNNSAKITIKIVTVECEDQSSSCYNQIKYFSR